MTRPDYSDLLRLWAKTTREGGVTAYHPVLCHLLDVAAVAEALWRRVLPPASRRRIAAELGVDESTAGRWVAFLAGTHDMGKASPAFQRQDRPRLIHLKRLGWPFPTRESRTPHGLVTARELPDLLAPFGLSRELARRIAAAVGGHHGIIPRTVDLNHLKSDQMGTGRWIEARRQLVDLLARALGVPSDCPPSGLGNTAAMHLAGLVSVADWIGSHGGYFTFADTTRLAAEPDPAATYLMAARTNADRALAALGWLRRPLFEAPPAFEGLFPAIDKPNDLQLKTCALADRIADAGPVLVVVEAPMGEGKSEAALYLAEHLAHAGGLAGFYFALPTQATSNQMYGRVRDCLENGHGAEIVDLQLLHGHASLSAEFELLRTRAEATFEPADVHGEPGRDGARAAVVAAEWFTHRKRGLLAPFGVGTIDQALLAVLQTRHVFVRLLGVAGKCVIFDEVHAYEAYMTRLLECLLEWLAALGSPVILLSATLPGQRRRALLDAYRRGLGSAEPARLPPAEYPRVSWAAAEDGDAFPVTVSALGRKDVTMQWVDGRLPAEGAAFPLAERLATALADGGCAAIVCNTVGRAQRLYRALKSWLVANRPVGWTEIDLLHARFPFAERDRREKRVLAAFGKPRPAVEATNGPSHVERPQRAILVATQLIEQSLDVDFDLLVSDPAPVDLVLQRLGRLHRHRRGRPAWLASPAAWLLVPEVDADGLPIFDRGTAWIYDGHVLLRSWLALRGRSRVEVPLHVPELIDEVYCDDREPPAGASAALRAAWQRTLAKHDAALTTEKQQAELALIKRPDFAVTDDLGDLSAHPREEDAPQLHEAFQALTRLTEPTIPLVLLHADELPGVENRRKPLLDHVQALLQRSLTLNHPGAVRALIDDRSPWSESPLLRNHRLRRLDANHEADVGPHRLRLDPELGVYLGDLKEE